jgi:hypothetical protein
MWYVLSLLFLRNPENRSEKKPFVCFGDEATSGWALLGGGGAAGVLDVVAPAPFVVVIAGTGLGSAGAVPAPGPAPLVFAVDGEGNLSVVAAPAGGTTILGRSRAPTEALRWLNRLGSATGSVLPVLAGVSPEVLRPF